MYSFCMFFHIHIYLSHQKAHQSDRNLQFKLKSEPRDFPAGVETEGSAWWQGNTLRRRITTPFATLQPTPKTAWFRTDVVGTALMAPFHPPEVEGNVRQFIVSSNVCFINLPKTSQKKINFQTNHVISIIYVYSSHALSSNHHFVSFLKWKNDSLLSTDHLWNSTSRGGAARPWSRISFHCHACHFVGWSLRLPEISFHCELWSWVL